MPPDVNERIAARVKALRAGQGLSLEALAARSDVSRSMLSLIERGESSPTAVVLEKVAVGLGVSLASLFAGADAVAPPEPLSRAVDRTPWTDPQTGYVRCNVSPPGFPSPIEIVDVVLPGSAHVAYESGPRDAGLHQQVWVQEGTLELTVDGRAHRLGPGDCLAMRLDGPTAFRNPTRRATRYVVVIASERWRAPPGRERLPPVARERGSAS